FLARYLFPLFPAESADYLAPATAALCGAIVGWAFRKWLNQVLGIAFRAFNLGFEAFTEGYLRVVWLFLKVGVLVLVGYGFLLDRTGHVLATVPTGFSPAQDEGYFLVNVQLPDSASLGRTDAIMRQV